MPESARDCAAAAGTGASVRRVTGAAWPRGTRDEESWQLAVLAEQVTALGLGEPPSEEELWGIAPDGDWPGGWPDGEDDLAAELVLTEAAAERDASPELFPAGLLSRDGSGMGAGFTDGGILDVLAPGAVLAGFAADAWSDGLGRLSDDELVGVLRAWRRLSSWAAAGELAAVAELAARRERDDSGPGAAGRPADCVPDELSCALTLTRRSAENLADRALSLGNLPATAAGLRLGRIDMPKALTLIDGVAGLDPCLARAVEDKVLAKAPGQTTGELRAAVRRAVFAADPAAARRRREAAEKQARVELWDEPAGTKALAGRDLPPAEVLAADKRISAIARELKKRGADGPLDLLRAKVYIALLAGQPLDHLITTSGDTALPSGDAGLPSDGAVPERGPVPERGTSGDEAASDGARPSTPGAPGRGDLGFGMLVGPVNLTVPLVTLLDLADQPGEVAGFGPVEAGTARTLLGATASSPATRWCLTVTDDTGRVIGHGCGRNAADDVRNVVIKLDRLAFPECDHRRESRGYQLSPRLRHLIEIRDKTCSFPGCRRPAVQCDKDHTVPYEQGGKTCECNVAPLCRRHHKIKQAAGWRLEQPRPGVLEWTTPSGRRYRANKG